MPNAATRLITLIMLLQRKPRQKASDLAAELGVSVRTLHRYIGMLDEMGIPVYSERGPHGGFSLVRGYKMPPLVFTPEEAVAVYLGTGLVEEMWGRLYLEAARGVLSKLNSVLPEEQRQEVAWARRALLATGMHRTDLEGLVPVLEKLRRAIRERRRLRMAYRAREQPQSSTRELDPYALIHRWGLWYLVGYCHLRRALRTFRVDRIQSVDLLAETFADPTDFDIQSYLETEPHMQPRYTVRLHFTPNAALQALDDRMYWQKVEEQPDGSVIVSFETPSLTWAARSALSYGPQVKVLEPGALRSMVRGFACATARQHAAEGDGDEEI